MELRLGPQRVIQVSITEKIGGKYSKGVKARAFTVYESTVSEVTKELIQAIKLKSKSNR